MKNKKNKTKKKFKISDLFWNTLLVFSVVVWSSMIFTFFANGCSYARSSVLGYRPVTILSESMEPTLLTHGMALCKFYEDDYEVGDIVVYEHNYEGKDILIIHRIIDIQDGVYTLRGDNNPTSDPWPVYKEDICCRVVGIWNGVKPVIDFILN